MASRKLEQEVATVERLLHAGATDPTIAALKKALQHRNNFLVSKAARVVNELGLRDLCPDLLRAAERFFVDPDKTDPQCWAKIALLQALSDLGHDDPEIYLRGLHHVQLEKVWGGAEDMAGPLRALCAHALVSCRNILDRELLFHLVELLFDPEPKVRVEAARAVGRIQKPEAALLLRARCLAADDEPEVRGAAMAALVDIQREEAAGFVRAFLDGDRTLAGEAALALSRLRTDDCCRLLIRRYENCLDRGLKEVLVTAITLTRTEAGAAFLAERDQQVGRKKVES